MPAANCSTTFRSTLPLTCRLTTPWGQTTSPASACSSRRAMIFTVLAGRIGIRGRLSPHRSLGLQLPLVPGFLPGVARSPSAAVPVVCSVRLGRCASGLGHLNSCSAASVSTTPPVQWQCHSATATMPPQSFGACHGGKEEPNAIAWEWRYSSCEIMYLELDGGRCTCTSTTRREGRLVFVLTTCWPAHSMRRSGTFSVQTPSTS